MDLDETKNIVLYIVIFLVIFFAIGIISEHYIADEVYKYVPESEIWEDFNDSGSMTRFCKESTKYGDPYGYAQPPGRGWQTEDKPISNIKQAEVVCMGNNTLSTFSYSRYKKWLIKQNNK